MLNGFQEPFLKCGDRYVTGLSARVTKRDLEKHFSSYGKVCLWCNPGNYLYVSGLLPLFLFYRLRTSSLIPLCVLIWIGSMSLSLVCLIVASVNSLLSSSHALFMVHVK